MAMYKHQADKVLPAWLEDLAIKEAAPKPKTPSEAPAEPPAPEGEAPPPPEGGKEGAPAPEGEMPPAPEGGDKGTNEPVSVPAEGGDAGGAGDPGAGGPPPAPPSGGGGGAGPEPEPEKAPKEDKAPKTEKEQTTDVGDALEKLKKQLDDLSTSMKDDVSKSVEDSTKNFDKKVEEVTSQIDALKGQMKDLSKEKDLGEQLKVLQKRLENLKIPDDADLNDSINSTASKIAALQRTFRRVIAIVKEAQSTFEFEFTKGRDSYYPQTKTIVTEASSVGLKPGIVPQIVEVKNPKTGVSVKFKHSKNDMVDDEDIAGFRYEASGNTWGVKELLIIND